MSVPVKSIVVGVLIFLGFVTLLSSCYTVDAGERAVLTTWGAVSGTVDPGVHFKAPIIQAVHTISNRQQVSRFDCTGNNHCDFGHAGVLQAYSRDQQPADIRVSVNWHVPVDKVGDVYTSYENLDALASATVWRMAPQEIKVVFGQFDAVNVVQSRDTFNAKVNQALAGAILGPLVIDSVQVENIDFSDAYEQAVEQRMTAQVAVEKQRQQLEQEKILAEQALAKAVGAANAVKAAADAEAYKVRAEGDASAAAISARAKALAGNPLLIEQTKAERWDGKLPTTVLPGGTIPFIETK